MQGWIGGKNTELDIKGNSDFSGKGGANANNTFKGTITVTVDHYWRTVIYMWLVRNASR